MSLNKIANELHEESLKIFGDNWKKKTDPLTQHMLMVSELAEATECVRKNEPKIWFKDNGKPEGEAVELVDCIMRILNYCVRNNIDIDEAFYAKRKYNINRNWDKEGKNV